MKTIHTVQEGIDDDNLNIDTFMQKHNPGFKKSKRGNYESNWKDLMTVLETMQLMEDKRYTITIGKYHGKMQDEYSKEKDKQITFISCNHDTHDIIEVYHSVISSCASIINLREKYGDKEKEALIDLGIKTTWELIGFGVFGENVPVDIFKDQFKYAFKQIDFIVFDDSELIVVPPENKRAKIKTVDDIVMYFLKKGGVDKLSPKERLESFLEETK